MQYIGSIFNIFLKNLKREEVNVISHALSWDILDQELQYVPRNLHFGNAPDSIT